MSLMPVGTVTHGCDLWKNANMSILVSADGAQQLLAVHQRNTSNESSLRYRTCKTRNEASPEVKSTAYEM